MSLVVVIQEVEGMRETAIGVHRVGPLFRASVRFTNPGDGSAFEFVDLDLAQIARLEEGLADAREYLQRALQTVAEEAAAGGA